MFILINIGTIFSIIYSSRIYGIIEKYWKKFQGDGSNIVRLENVKIELKNVNFFHLIKNFNLMKVHFL